MTEAQLDVLREVARQPNLHGRRGIARALRNLVADGMITLRSVTSRYGTDYEVAVTDAGKAALNDAAAGAA
jgi:hypothetical protein